MKFDNFKINLVGTGHTLSYNKAQVFIEFTFCMIIIFLIIYGLTQILIWTGVDIAERRRANKTTDIIIPKFYNSIKIKGYWLY